MGVGGIKAGEEAVNRLFSEEAQKLIKSYPCGPWIEVTHSNGTKYFLSPNEVVYTFGGRSHEKSLTMKDLFGEDEAN